MALRPMPDVRLERQSAMRSRALRRPRHEFRLHVRPWQIVPNFIAPVLPGDTLKGATFNMRVLSKPLNDRLSGWWHEFFVFYVRVGDLDSADQDDLKSMLITNAALTGVSGLPSYYMADGKFGWPFKAYARVVASYFRNEDGGLGRLIGDYFACKIAGQGSWWDSIATNDDLPDPITGDPEDWEQQWKAYQQLRNAKLTVATWAEYLAMQGVSTGPQLVEEESSLRRPELVHFTRDFQYPVNAVEPSTGVPSALVQWNVADKLRKGRFCAEPGVLIGLSVIRPKAYLKNQRGNATDYLMDRAAAWMPQALDTDPHAAMRMFDGVTVGGGAGPVYGSSVDYWVDPRDLLQRGDQFTNIDFGSTVAGALSGINIVDLPIVADGAVNPAFPGADDADALFSGASKFIEIDGSISLSIASRAGHTDATGRRTGGW